MNLEPRYESEYKSRQVKAARRVLVDIGQILATYRDCVTLIGGWVPDLLLQNPDEPHVGSIDVDLALDAEKLNDGRYADMLKLLLDTRRYEQGPKPFQLMTEVDLHDSEPAVAVPVEFLAPRDVKLDKNRPKLLPGFRVLQSESCVTAFNEPENVTLSGESSTGAENTVHIRVASLADLLIMKAYALDGRDKPKDAYDICYLLDNAPEGYAYLAAKWRSRAEDKYTTKALEILAEKFNSVRAFGPTQVQNFYDSLSPEEREIQARKAFELVNEFVQLVPKR